MQELSNEKVKRIKEQLNKLKKIFKGGFQISQVSHGKDEARTWDKPDIYYFCETKEDAEKIIHIQGIFKKISEENVEVIFFWPCKNNKLAALRKKIKLKNK